MQLPDEPLKIYLAPISTVNQVMIIPCLRLLTHGPADYLTMSIPNAVARTVCFWLTKLDFMVSDENNVFFIVAQIDINITSSGR